MERQEYIGLSKKSAQDKADQDNLIFRLVSIDGEKYLGLPSDRRTDRICVELEKGKVIKAIIQ